MFLDSDVSEVCGTVDDLTLERPALSERSFLDSQCKSVLPDSFFVTYKSSDGDYLSGSVGYADAYQIDALRSACRMNAQQPGRQSVRVSVLAAEISLDAPSQSTTKTLVLKRKVAN